MTRQGLWLCRPRPKAARSRFVDGSRSRATDHRHSSRPSLIALAKLGGARRTRRRARGRLACLDAVRAQGALLHPRRQLVPFILRHAERACHHAIAAFHAAAGFINDRPSGVLRSAATGSRMPQLVHEQYRSRDHDSCGAEQQAQVPEQPSAGEQRNGSNHQPNLQKHFAEVETVGLAVREIGLLFQFAGFRVQFLLLVAWARYLLPRADYQSAQWALSTEVESLATLLGIMLVGVTILWSQATGEEARLRELQPKYYELLRTGGNPAHNGPPVIEQLRLDYLKKIKARSLPRQVFQYEHPKYHKHRDLFVDMCRMPCPPQQAILPHGLFHFRDPVGALEDFARLGAIGGADDAVALHEINQVGGAPVADA